MVVKQITIFSENEIGGLESTAGLTLHRSIEKISINFFFDEVTPLFFIFISWRDEWFDWFSFCM